MATGSDALPSSDIFSIPDRVLSVSRASRDTTVSARTLVEDRSRTPEITQPPKLSCSWPLATCSLNSACRTSGIPWLALYRAVTAVSDTNVFVALAIKAPTSAREK